jgi:hypothetical protein
MTDLPFIVGLCGPAGCGKSTVAQAYAKTARNIIAHAFATPLYQLVSQFCFGDASRYTELRAPATKEVPWTAETAPIPTLIGWTPRKLMQVVGTDCFRNHVGPGVWVEKAVAAAKSSKACGFDIVVMEDVRFPSEAEVCDVVVEVVRPGVEYAGNHASAKRLPDGVIGGRMLNDADVDEAVMRLRAVIRMYRDLNEPVVHLTLAV